MNEGLIGQLFGQNLQSFPESTCQTEYMDILGGDMNDGRLPGQRTRCHSIVQTRPGENLAHSKIQSFPDSR